MSSLLAPSYKCGKLGDFWAFVCSKRSGPRSCIHFFLFAHANKPESHHLNSTLKNGLCHEMNKCNYFTEILTSLTYFYYPSTTLVSFHFSTEADNVIPALKGTEFSLRIFHKSAYLSHWYPLISAAPFKFSQKFANNFAAQDWPLVSLPPLSTTPLVTLFSKIFIGCFCVCCWHWR